jgi:4-carboxymuconolactone decarboxylase
MSSAKLTKQPVVRLPPVPPAERTHEMRNALALITPDRVDATGNFMPVLAHNPALLRAWVPFVKAMYWEAQIPKRDCELLILRTGWLCQAGYEWGQHVKFALAAGLTHDDIERVIAGPDAGWDEFDRALLRAVDELHTNSVISDDTWQTLASRYSSAELVEVPMMVGQYHLIAWLMNSAGILPEDGEQGLEAR